MLGNLPDVVRSAGASDAARLVVHGAELPVQVTGEALVVQSSIAARAVSRRLSQTT